MSIAFVVFHDHPQTVKAITDQVNKAIGEIQNFGTKGCLAITFCGLAILSQFNNILGIIDQKLGELGIVKVAEFVAYIIEVIISFGGCFLMNKFILNLNLFKMLRNCL